MSHDWSTHDGGLFTVDVPAGWVVEQPSPGAMRLTDARGQLVLRMTAVSRVAPGVAASIARTPPARASAAKATLIDAQAELQRWVETQNQVKVRQAPRVVPGSKYPTATTEGLEHIRAQRRDVSWFKWMVAGWRNGLMGWRYWAVLNPHLLVLVSCNGKPAVVEKMRGTLDRVVASMHLPERDILVGRTFTEVVVSLARTWFPQTAVAIVDDVHLQIGTRNVSLVNLHRNYLASPDELQRHVKAFLTSVQEELPASAVAGSWGHARDRVLPVFLTEKTLRNANSRMVIEEWINGLSIAYVLEDERGGEMAITREDLARWKVEVEELHDQAMANLVAYSHEHTMQGQKGEGLTMLCLGGDRGKGERGDKHHATRMLLPEFHRKLREHLGLTFYAAIPTRDLLIAFTAADDDVLDRVRQQIVEDYARAEGTGAGLSGKLFLVTPDGIAGDPGEEEGW